MEECVLDLDYLSEYVTTVCTQFFFNGISYKLIVHSPFFSAAIRLKCFLT